MDVFPDGNWLEWATGGAGMAGGFLIMRAIGAAVRWAWESITGRLDKREEHIDQANRELIDNQREEIATLRQNEVQMRERLDKLEDRLNDCLRKHIDSDREIARLRQLVEPKG
jgi:chromosome segregation ATPase